MRYLPYPEYLPVTCPDEVEIPSGWEIRRLKFAASCNDEALPETTDPDYEIAYVDISSVDLINGITATEVLNFEEAPSRARRIVRDGDTIVSTERTYLKAIASIASPPENMIVSTGFAVIRPSSFIDSRFLGYALQNSAFVEGVVARSTGVSYPAINPSTLISLSVAYPEDKTEQQHIADFLDWKIGQIDALIAKKQALIEKLKEKRLAVITQAVTKGIDRAAQMRESGISWLGKVPASWRVKRLRYCAGMVTSGSRGWAEYFSESGALFLRITNLDRESISLKLDDLQRVEPPDGAEGARTLTKAGDLLVSITADLGSVAVIPEGFESAYISQHLSLVRLDCDDIDPNWIAYSILSLAGKYQLNTAGYGGTKIQLSLSDIKDITFCHPATLDEQQSVLRVVQREIGRNNKLIELAEDAVDRLTEYRTALITATTTGKIDVRNVNIREAG